MGATRRRLILSVALFLILLGMGAYVLLLVEENRQIEQRRLLTEIAAAQGRSIHSHLDHALSATSALSIAVLQGQGEVSNFPSVARDIMHTHPEADNLQLAPEGVVQKIFPLKGNEQAIGHDLLKDPKRRTEALAAIKSRKLTLAGPFTLIQGGEAMIGRLPVFLPADSGKDKFWGFAIVLVKMPKFLAAVKLEGLKEHGYDYKLWRRDPGTKRRQVFARSTNRALRDSDPVVYKIGVPNGQWSLSLAPNERHGLSPLIAAQIGATLLFSAAIAFAFNRSLSYADRLKRDVQERTQDLSDANRQLEHDIEIRQRVKELSDAINRINSITGQTEPFEAIMDMVVSEAAEAIGCEKALIAMRDDSAWIVKHVWKYREELVGTRLKDDEVPGIEAVPASMDPVIINDTATDRRIDSETMIRLGIKSMMVLPLTAEERIVGVLIFHYCSDNPAFTEHEIDFAHKLAASLSLAVANHRLYDSQKHLLSTIQGALLAVPESIPGLTFGHVYRSATKHADVGGDFYELFGLEDDNVGILVGDVSGHGVEAANLAALVKNTVRAFSAHDLSPARVLNRTSEVVRQATDPSVFVSAFFGVLNTRSGIFAYCNAGHPSAFLMRADKLSWLPATSGIIGAIDGLEYQAKQAQLLAGDICVIYTDGAIEARRGKEMFGEERLAQAIRDLPNLDLNDLPTAIIQRIEEFSSGSLADDVAIVAFSISERANPAHS